MNKQTIDRILKKREITRQELEFDYLMALSDEKFERLDKRAWPPLVCAGKAEFCWNYAGWVAAGIRDMEELDIIRGRKRLNQDGRLIRVPTLDEIKMVDKLIREMKL